MHCLDLRSLLDRWPEVGPVVGFGVAVGAALCLVVLAIQSFDANHSDRINSHPMKPIRVIQLYLSIFN